MCGRFSLYSTADIVKRLFQLKMLPDYPARYNVSPTDPVLIVRGRVEDGAVEREGALVRWGFVPAWAKEPTALPLMINAKAETVAEKPAFRSAMRTQRCLIPADGFYEWKTLVGGSKQPMFIREKSDHPFALAGLWSRWRGEVAGEETRLESCVILTTEANPLVRPVHDRMPVIVPGSAWDVWLDPTVQDPDVLQPILVPRDADHMEMWPVSPKVNKAGVDGPDLIRKEGQQGLF